MEIGRKEDLNVPMMTKEEQGAYKKKKAKAAAVKEEKEFGTSDTFQPEKEFVYFKTIKNVKVPIQIQGLEGEIGKEGKEGKEVRCEYCGSLHIEEDSLFIPVSFYDDKDNRIFEGYGHYDSFECVYRVILHRMENRDQSYLMESAKYNLHHLFRSMYPSAKLVPAPLYSQMSGKWSPEYRFVPLPGCAFKRGCPLFQIYSTPL